VVITVLDSAGAVVRTLEERVMKDGLKKGLNRVAWDLSADAPKPRKEGGEDFEFGPPARGPMVLPGVYTVRLEVAGKRYQEQVEVQLDPLVAASAEALAAQHAAASRLAEEIGRVSTALRGMDVVAAELADRRDSVKRLRHELSAELEAAWKAVDVLLERQLGVLARPEDVPFWSKGPRLLERLQALFGDVDDAFAAPSAAQSAYLAALEAEAAAAVVAWREFLSGDVAALDASLEAAGLPGLALPEVSP
jgi:hypothetical protein